MAKGEDNSISDSHWLNWCRLCGSKEDIQGNVKIYTNETENTQNSVVEMAIRKFFDVHMQGKDEPYGVLCETCYTFMIKLIDFAEHVTKVQAMFEVFRNTAEKPDYETPNTKDLPEITPEKENINLLSAEEGSYPSSTAFDQTANNEISLSIDGNNVIIKSEVETQIEFNEYSISEAVDFSSIDEDMTNTSSTVESEKNPPNTKDLPEIAPKEDNINFLSAEEVSYPSCTAFDQTANKEISLSIDINNEIIRGENETQIETTEYSISEAFNFSSKDEDMTNTSTTVESEKHPKGNVSYYCKLCNRTLDSKRNLRKHMERMHEKSMKCHVCGKQFTGKMKLSQHKAVHISEHPFSCKICNARFKTEVWLNKHHQIHVAPMKCDVCGKKFTKKTMLTKHKLVHSEEHPFSCKICNVRFTSATLLNRHHKIHEGSKLKCDEETQSCAAFDQTANKEISLSIDGNNVIINSEEETQSCTAFDQTVNKEISLSIDGNNVIINSEEEKQSCAAFDQTTNKEISLSIESNNEMIKSENETQIETTEYSISEAVDFSSIDEDMTNTSSTVESEKHPPNTKDLPEIAPKEDNINLLYAEEVSYPSCTAFDQTANKEISLSIDINNEIIRGENETQIETTEYSISEAFNFSSKDEDMTNTSTTVESEKHPKGNVSYYCKLCNRTLNSKINLRKHVERMHEKSMKCHVCGKQFTNKRKFSKHKAGHINERPFSCKICDIRFKTEVWLNKHHQIHVAPMKCDVCGKKFTEKAKLTQHKLVHSEELKSFSCKICNARFSSGTFLYRHHQIHDGSKLKCDEETQSCAAFDQTANKEISSSIDGKSVIVNSEEKTQSCAAFDQTTNKEISLSIEGNNGIIKSDEKTASCTAFDQIANKEISLSIDINNEIIKSKEETQIETTQYSISEAFNFSSKDEDMTNTSSTVEIEKHPKGNVSYYCKLCNRTLDSKRSLRKHMDRMHVAPMKCLVCGKQFTNKMRFLKHKAGHINERPFSCNICDARFKTETWLNKHHQIHVAPMKCDVCGKKFTEKTILTKHKLMHSEEHSLSCKICNVRFTSATLLNRHHKIHEGSKLNCDVCGQQFTKMAMLTKHKLVHSDEHPLRCKICNVRFANATLLNRHHKKIHEKSKLTCNVCGQQFTEKAILRKHKLVHSEERHFTCTTCNAGFKSRWSLNRHLQIHSTPRKYKCTVCSYATKDATALRYHLLTHTNLRPSFKCKYCNKDFPYAHTVKRHKKKVHPKEYARDEDKSSGVSKIPTLHELRELGFKYHRDSWKTAAIE